MASIRFKPSDYLTEEEMNQMKSLYERTVWVRDKRLLTIPIYNEIRKEYHFLVGKALERYKKGGNK